MPQQRRRNPPLPRRNPRQRPQQPAQGQQRPRPRPEGLRATQGAHGNAAVQEELNRGSRRAEGDAGMDTVGALGTNTDVTAETVRAGLTDSTHALAALTTLTEDPAFQQLTAGQQGALLERFSQAPNAATAQYVRGIAAYHRAEDPDAGLASYTDALNPDGGNFTHDGTAYTVDNGQLMSNGQAAGTITTDGQFSITDGASGSMYDDIHNTINLTEGTGRDEQTLLNLHDADRYGRMEGNDNINDTFEDAAVNTLRQSRKEGMDPIVVSGYRSVEEQNRLYAQGRTTPGNRVTNARGGSSWHNYGLGMDVAQWNDRGTNIDWADGDFYDRYGAIAEDNGLEWGGRWTNPVDRPHVNWQAQGSPRDNLNAYNRDGLEGAWDRLGIGEVNG